MKNSDRQREKLLAPIAGEARSRAIAKIISDADYLKNAQELGLTEEDIKQNASLAVLGKRELQGDCLDIHAGCSAFTRSQIFGDIKLLNTKLQPEELLNTDLDSVLGIIKTKAVLYKLLNDSSTAMLVAKSVKREEDPERQKSFKPGQVISPVQINVNRVNGENLKPDANAKVINVE